MCGRFTLTIVFSFLQARFGFEVEEALPSLEYRMLELCPGGHLVEKLRPRPG